MTPLTLSSPTKATLFRIILWRCWAQSEHGIARLAAARERLDAANTDNRRLYEALEPVVGSYCPGLARTPYHIHRYGARLE